VQYERVYDKRLKIDVYQEIGPVRYLVVGHTAVQRPGWRRCNERGHRIWSCDECRRVTHDADCAYGTGA
jgi:hypothetical protein